MIAASRRHTAGHKDGPHRESGCDVFSGENGARQIDNLVDETAADSTGTRHNLRPVESAGLVHEQEGTQAVGLGGTLKDEEAGAFTFGRVVGAGAVVGAVTSRA